MEASSSYKRSRDGDEMEESNLKRVKSDDNFNTVEADEHRRGDENENDIKTRKDEECHFLQLFTLVLNTIISLKHPEEESICKSIQSIIDSYKVLSCPSFSAIDFSKWENICGYLYRYGPHGAGFARSRILNAVRNCRILEETLKKSELRIICLGTGPGNDAVGLCSALSELQNLKCLKVTLVDKFEEWSLCIKLAKTFIQEGNFGKNSELFRKSDVEFSFVQTDLPGNIKSDEEYFKLLVEADVIVMSKLVSTLDSSNYNESARLIIQSLHENMKENAIILLNDTFYDGMWSNFNRVYDSEDNDLYKSSALAEERFNSNDAISSKLWVNVLVKKKSPTKIFSLERKAELPRIPPSMI